RLARLTGDALHSSDRSAGRPGAAAPASRRRGCTPPTDARVAPGCSRAAKALRRCRQRRLAGWGERVAPGRTGARLDDPTGNDAPLELADEPVPGQPAWPACRVEFGRP